MKLNSDDQTLAESKILILYILDKVGKPISHNELLELVISISDMNYFYFQQFLLDLIEDNYVVAQANEPLTEEGKFARPRVNCRFREKILECDREAVVSAAGGLLRGGSESGQAADYSPDSAGISCVRGGRPQTVKEAGTRPVSMGSEGCKAYHWRPGKRNWKTGWSDLLRDKSFRGGIVSSGRNYEAGIHFGP